MRMHLLGARCPTHGVLFDEAMEQQPVIFEMIAPLRDEESELFVTCKPCQRTGIPTPHRHVLLALDPCSDGVVRAGVSK